MNKKLSKLLKELTLPRLRRLFTHTIWRQEAIKDESPKGKLFGVLRTGSIVIDGMTDNKILGQAAALGYSSLLAMGPILAISVMISSFVLQRQDEHFVIDKLNSAISFIAPSASDLSDEVTERSRKNPTPQTLTSKEGTNPPKYYSPVEGEAQPEGNLNPQLIGLIENLVKSAQSGTVGVVGSFFLILIAIQMIISIEKSFNSIWGVKRGRSMTERVVFYWTFLSLGAVLGFTSVTMMSAATFINLFDNLPFGATLLAYSTWLAPFLAFGMLVMMLAVFYRFIPNTNVYWRPAFIGAICVALLLYLNNYLSFVYIHRAVTARSLYGSIAIAPILMFGLYVFWLFILIGGQITYSVQNADTLTYKKAWQNVSTYTREILSLTALVQIARRFKACKPPFSADELDNEIRVPRNILNSCLSRLSDMGLVSTMERTNSNYETTICYEPARPLETIYLSEFKLALEQYGSNEGANLIGETDPIVQLYQKEYATQPRDNDASLNELIDQHPLGKRFP